MGNLIKKSVVYCIILRGVSLFFRWWGVWAQEEQLTKEERVKKIYTHDQYIPLMDVQETKRSLESLMRSLDEVTTELEEQKSRNVKVGAKLDNAELLRNNIIKDMTATQLDLRNKEKEIQDLVSRIHVGELALKTIVKDLEDLEGYIWTYSKFLFKITNDFYLNEEAISDIKLLAKSEEIGVTLSKDDMVRLLHDQMTIAFEQMQSYYEKYEKERLRLNIVIGIYEQSIKDAEESLVYLDQQAKHLETIEQLLEDEKEYADKELSSVLASEIQLKQQIGKLKDITKTIEKTWSWSSNAHVNVLLKLADLPNDARYFSRPLRLVPPLVEASEVLSENTSEWWIFLASEQGDEIYAPAPSIVYEVVTDKEFGLQRVILIHKYGYVSILSPFNKVFVKKNQVLQRGEIIGLSWGKPWTKGASSKSKKSHTHRQILKNGVMIDPLQYVDLSVYQDETELAPVYRIKRKQDYLSRKVSLDDLPELVGETVEQRRDYFLWRLKAWPFSDPNLWLNASKSTGVDPVFWMCIWAAETSFRNFKTGNNIWNVGNTDSWATREFASPQSWVSSLFATLINQYLGDYHTMDQLSRFWNKTGPIYASSSFNWQKNIMRCLSMIYEQNVSEQYFFRIVN